MKKMICICLLIFVMGLIAKAQPKDGETKQGNSNAFHAGMDFTIGDFKLTHNVGFSFDYSYAAGRYGKMAAKPANSFAFTFNFGGDHYLGIDGIKGYTNVHSYGGVIYNPLSCANLSLTFGPNLGLSGGESNFGIGADFRGSWYLSQHFALSPGVVWIKEFTVPPRYAITGRLTYSF